MKSILLISLMSLVACGQNDEASIPPTTPVEYVCAHKATGEARSCNGLTGCRTKVTHVYECVSSVGEVCGVEMTVLKSNGALLKKETNCAAFEQWEDL